MTSFVVYRGMAIYSGPMNHWLGSCLLLFICTQIIQGSVLQADLPKCHIQVNDVLIEKSVGDVWNSTSDTCMKHTCEVDDRGNAVERTFREYCTAHHTCNDEFQLVHRKNQCCGECVATKCSFNKRLYKIGEMWKSEDNCTFYECGKSRSGPDDDYIVSAKINKYKKSCPPLAECPSSRILTKDCCKVCDTRSPATDRTMLADTSDFVHPIDRNTDLFSRETYLNHPCRRECRKGAPPMACYYTFMVEWYETLSKACFECPFTHTDCYRPHCIFGDGSRRSVLVVNRMMPGPPLEVCLGDTIVVEVENHLMGESTTIHWHGLHQKETPYFDGVPHITQCAIPTHTSFEYRVKAENPGTHWWHSHVGLQRADGSFGALVIRQPIADIPPEARIYDHDLLQHVMIMQDWDHRTGISGFNSFHHSIGDNKPPNILINGKGRYFELPVHKKTDAITNGKNGTAAGNGSSTKRADVATNANDNTSRRFSYAALPSVPAVPPLSTIYHRLPSEKPPIRIPTDPINSSEEIPIHPFESLKITRADEDVLINEEEISANLQSKKRSIREANANLKGSIEAQITPYEVFHVTAGYRYRFRTINSGFLNCPLEISVDNHTLTVIASDGSYFEPVAVDTLVSYAGERFDFVVNADQPIYNYWVRIKGLMDCDERYNKAHQGAILRYAGAADVEPDGELSYDFKRTGLQLNSLNRGTGHVDSVSIAELTSLDANTPELLEEHTDFKFFVYYDFYDKNFPHFNHPTLYNMSNVAKQSEKFFGPQLNHVTMKMPAQPLLLARERNDEAKFCNASALAARNINCQTEFCECTHVLQVPLNATVELIIVDEGYKYDANHPFHLHGHNFRVVAMERIKPSGISIEEVQRLDDAGQILRRLNGAPVKDTVTVPDGGYTIIRFVANNPGFWLFHCHIDFHVEVGMAIVFKVGDYNQMRPLPKNFPTCYNYKVDNMDDHHQHHMNRPSDSMSIHYQQRQLTISVASTTIVISLFMIVMM